MSRAQDETAQRESQSQPTATPASAAMRDETFSVGRMRETAGSRATLTVHRRPPQDHKANTRASEPEMTTSTSTSTRSQAKSLGSAARLSRAPVMILVVIQVLSLQDASRFGAQCFAPQTLQAGQPTSQLQPASKSPKPLSSPPSQLMSQSANSPGEFESPLHFACDTSTANAFEPDDRRAPTARAGHRLARVHCSSVSIRPSRHDNSAPPPDPLTRRNSRRLFGLARVRARTLSSSRLLRAP